LTQASTWLVVLAVSSSDRAEITALHPRPDFKRRILEAFT
jgi:hypothetical protein